MIEEAAELMVTIEALRCSGCSAERGPGQWLILRDRYGRDVSLELPISLPESVVRGGVPCGHCGAQILFSQAVV